MSINKKIFNILLNVDSQDEKYSRLIRNKSHSDKLNTMKEIMNFASTTNKNIEVRNSALACIYFFKFWTESKNTFYKDVDIINEFYTIELILEDNCIELVNIIEKSISEFYLNIEYTRLCHALLALIPTYIIEKNIFNKYKSTLINYLELESKYKNKNISIAEKYIYETLVSLSEKIYK